jgi:hypothetical protein
VHSIYILKYVINSCGKILKENEVNKRSTDLKTANIYYQTYKDFSGNLSNNKLSSATQEKHKIQDESNYEVKDFINYNMIKLEKLLVGLKEKPIKKVITAINVTILFMAIFFNRSDNSFFFLRSSLSVLLIYTVHFFGMTIHLLSN